MLAPFGLALLLGFRIARMSPAAAQAAFWGYAALMGLSLAGIFLVYTGASIARVFFISAGTFAATAVWGYTTRTDLSRFGSFLVMGLIGIVLASLVNLFVGSSALQFALSMIGRRRVHRPYCLGHPAPEDDVRGEPRRLREPATWRSSAR